MALNKLHIKQIQDLQTQLNKSLSTVLNVGNTASQHILMGTYSIGLGTTTPSTNLHIDGSFRYVDGAQTSGYILTTDSTGVASWTASSNIISATSQGIYGGSGSLVGTTTVTMGTNNLLFSTNGSSGLLLLDPSTGQVGIGATSFSNVAWALEVQGRTFFKSVANHTWEVTGRNSANRTAINFAMPDISVGFSNAAGMSFGAQGTDGIGSRTFASISAYLTVRSTSQVSGGLVFKTAVSGINSLSPIGRLTITPEGYVGIGTDFTPTNLFHIRGIGSTSATTSLLVQNSSITEMFRINDDGKVSIGSPLTAPSRLSIRGLTNTSSTTSLTLQDSTGTQILRVSDDKKFYFNNPQGTHNFTIKSLGNTSATLAFALENSDSGGISNIFNITDDGNLFLKRSASFSTNILGDNIIQMFSSNYTLGVKASPFNGIYVNSSSNVVLSGNKGGSGSPYDNILFLDNLTEKARFNLTNGSFGIGITPTARLHIKGSGSTSATTSLLVQNSALSTLFSLKDDGHIGHNIAANVGMQYYLNGDGSAYGMFITGNNTAAHYTSNFGETQGGFLVRNLAGGNIGLKVGGNTVETAIRYGSIIELYGANTSANVALQLRAENGVNDFAIDIISGDIKFRSGFNYGATSTVTQKGSDGKIRFNNSLWNGTNVVSREFDIQAVASTTVNEKTDLNFGYNGSTILSLQNDGVVVHKSFLKAALPAAVAGGIIRVSDEIGGDTIAYSDGTNWKRVSDGTIVA